jgi:hypothetical protein
MNVWLKDDLTIATTPLHHTSFRNIIEKFVKPENIHIIKLNLDYNEIDEIPTMKKCDLVVITHLFGQDMDLSVLSEFKKKHNCIILEDRVQGGSLEAKFSNEIVDISIYSMAMDKRPVALGGGFMYIKKEYEEFINATLERIGNLPKEKKRKRFIDLIKKIPTYFIYNSRFTLFILINSIRFLNVFIKKINILNLTLSYRTKNPGFSHFDYMLKPSNALLKSMYKKFDHFEEMEKLYTDKHNFFISNLSSDLISCFFPFYKKIPSLTPYNTIIIEENLVSEFAEYLNSFHISCLLNPTYKLFNFSYETISTDKKFNDGIVYLPSLAKMNKREILYLCKIITDFFESKSNS